jgi:hypothetical protein
MIVRSLWFVPAAALLACGGFSAVKVSPTGAFADPRPAGCDLEFLAEAPKRGFDTLADLQSHVTLPPRGGAREVLRDKACALGADAIILTRDFVLNEYGHVLVEGKAIKYQGPEVKPVQAPSSESAPVQAPSPESAPVQAPSSESAPARAAPAPVDL